MDRRSPLSVLVLVAGLQAWSAPASAAPSTPGGSAPGCVTQRAAALAAPAARASRYETLAMDAKYLGEERGKSIDGKYYYVRYLQPEEQTPYRITFREGKLVNWRGEELRGPRTFLYVMDREGNFLVNADAMDGYFHHSSFVAGEEVAAAGTFILSSEGKLLSITRLSGHYLPARRHLRQALQRLKENGVDLGNTWADYFPAEEFLRDPAIYLAPDAP